ncbi:hypothetical protein [Pseudoramibacter faecis]|nr:hypothetical protein [Pseudoramibacter sp. HA2172]
MDKKFIEKQNQPPGQTGDGLSAMGHDIGGFVMKDVNSFSLKVAA